VMSRGPGRILEIIAIDLPRPRTIDLMDTPVFVDYRRRIRHHLTEIPARA
jgi:NitT/TauT family transport system ATP-binding protein